MSSFFPTKQYSTDTPHLTQATTHVPFRRCAEKRGKGEGMGGRHEGQEGERPHLVLVVDIRREGP